MDAWNFLGERKELQTPRSSPTVMHLASQMNEFDEDVSMKNNATQQYKNAVGNGIVAQNNGNKSKSVYESDNEDDSLTTTGSNGPGELKSSAPIADTEKKHVRYSDFIQWTPIISESENIDDKSENLKQFEIIDNKLRSYYIAKSLKELRSKSVLQPIEENSVLVVDKDYSKSLLSSWNEKLDQYQAYSNKLSNILNPTTQNSKVEVNNQNTDNLSSKDFLQSISANCERLVDIPRCSQSENSKSESYSIPSTSVNLRMPSSAFRKEGLQNTDKGTQTDFEYFPKSTSDHHFKNEGTLFEPTESSIIPSSNKENTSDQYINLALLNSKLEDVFANQKKDEGDGSSNFSNSMQKFVNKLKNLKTPRKSILKQRKIHAPDLQQDFQAASTDQGIQTSSESSVVNDGTDNISRYSNASAENQRGQGTQHDSCTPQSKEEKSSSQQ